MNNAQVNSTIGLTAFFLFLLVSVEFTVAFGQQKSIASYGAIDYTKNLSPISVKGNIISNTFGPVFLVGCNVRGQAHNLRDGLFDDWWTYRDSDAESIKAYGFNAVRLLVYWEVVETSHGQGDFTYNDTYIERIRETVEAYNRRGIYAILNLHNYRSVNILGEIVPTLGNDCDFADAFFSDTSPTSAREHLKGLWLRLSEVFRDCTGVAGYDILNEPRHGAGSLTNQQVADYWFDIADYVTATLRNSGDLHTIFVNFAPYVSSATYMRRKLVDSNVVYSPHWYTGMDASTFEVIYNDYSTLALDFRDGLNLTMSHFNVPFVMEEQGFGSKNLTKDDPLDVWLRNAIAIHKTSPLMQGWLYWSYVAYGGIEEGGGWQNTLIEHFVNAPI